MECLSNGVFKENVRRDPHASCRKLSPQKPFTTVTSPPNSWFFTSYFVKTTKGSQEIRNRQAGLTALQRSFLVMVNGKQSAVELFELLGVDLAQGKTAIADLVAQGLIERLDGSSSQTSLGQPGSALASTIWPPDQARIDGIVFSLSQRIGPIAKIIVKRDVGLCKSEWELIKKLSENIEGGAEIQAFIRELMGES